MTARDICTAACPSMWVSAGNGSIPGAVGFMNRACLPSRSLVRPGRVVFNTLLTHAWHQRDVVAESSGSVASACLVGSQLIRACTAA